MYILKKKKNIIKNTPVIPKDTKIGLLTGIVTMVILILLFIYSTLKRGNAGVGVGLVGMIVMVAGCYGLIMSIRGIKKKDCMYFTIPVIGIGLNGLVFVSTFVLYVVGLFI